MSHNNFKDEVYKQEKGNTWVIFFLGMAFIAFLLYAGYGDQQALSAGYIH